MGGPSLLASAVEIGCSLSKIAPNSTVRSKTGHPACSLPNPRFWRP